MAAIAAGFGMARIARIVRGSRRDTYIAPREYIPSSTADMWKSARPRPCR